MKYIQGGLLLKDENNKGFDPIYKMMNSDSCHLEVLSYTSLNSFIIKLTVNTDDSQYIEVLDDNVVTSFVLKFEVITSGCKYVIDKYKDIEKSAVSMNSFINEAKQQQHVFIESITRGSPLCPSIANVALFDNDSSQRLIDFLLNLNDKRANTVDTESMDIFNYLSERMKTPCENQQEHEESILDHYEIGVIVMPTIENSNTLYHYIRPGNDINKEAIEEAIANAFSQIVRLFIDIGIISFDLHTNNILILDDQECKLIDFDRITDINNDFISEFKDIQETTDEIEKYKFISKVMNKIYEIINNRQIEWVQNYIKNLSICSRAFDILKKNMEMNDEKAAEINIKKKKQNQRKKKK